MRIFHAKRSFGALFMCAALGLAGCANQASTITAPPSEIAAKREVTVVDDDTLIIVVKERVNRNVSTGVSQIDRIGPQVGAAMLLAAADEARSRGFDRLSIALAEPEAEGSYWYYNNVATKIRVSYTMRGQVTLGRIDPDTSWSGTVAQAEAFAAQLQAS